MNIFLDNKWIGQRTIRPDGMDKVTGRAQFAADTTMPGMIWGKVLRSPHPHARIRSIDTSKAEKLPGADKSACGRQTLCARGQFGERGRGHVSHSARVNTVGTTPRLRSPRWPRAYRTM